MEVARSAPAGQLGRILSGWQGNNPAAEVNSRLMARSLGAVYVAGATLALVWVLVPSPPQSDRLAVAVLALIGELVGVTLLSGLLDSSPRLSFEVAVAIATVLISLAVFFVRVRGTGLSYLYMWCTPYAYWFFPRARALLQAGLVIVGFAVAALAASRIHPTLAGEPSTDWGNVVLLAGTVLIVGELVRRLGLTIEESHRRFARVFAEAPTPMARLDADGIVTDANTAFCRAMGRSDAQVIGSSVRDLAPAEQMPMLERSRADLLSGEAASSQLELDCIRPDGSGVSLLLNVSLLGRPGRQAEMFVQALDLTERKQAEQALTISEQRYRTLVETSQAIVWSADPDGTITFVNDAVEPVLGYKPEQLVGRSLATVLPEEDRDSSMERFARLQAGHAVTGETPHRRRDGRTILGSYSVAPLPGRNGEVSGFVGTVIDVTERRRAEEALRVSEARLRAVIDNAPAAITIRDPDGRLYAINREAARLLGGEPADFLGRDDVELIPKDAENRSVQADNAHVLANGEPVVREGALVLEDGPHSFLVVAFTLPAGPEGPPLVCRISFDVTDRELARHELIRSNEQRRRLLVELVRAQEDERRRIAADVHDESIQVLAGVAIRLGLLSSQLDRPEQQRLIVGLDESVRRGIKSLRQLLFDLRLPALDELGLAAALGSYLSETIAREGTTYTLEDRLEVDPPAELRTVLYRVSQEALSNVRKHAHAQHVEVTLSQSAAGFTVTVRDDGVGFDPADQPDAVPGHLGMVGMRERVQAAGGWIEVRSEPGRGTEVEFGVPAGREQSISLIATREG